ncbi:MAG: hypothetical protein U9P82_02575 [Bacteroidota bacterium]|jgi:hypothetical protein|nr:hypothetical protein [Bacteroidota bacterium]
MKSNKNFQKSKKNKSFGDEREMKVKKVNASKKQKYFKKEIFDEIEEFEDIDLYGKEDDFLDDEEEEND